MHIKIVMWNIGKICMIIGFSFSLPIAWSIYYGSIDLWALVIPMLLSFLLGGLLLLSFKGGRKGIMRQREGYAFVTFGWLIVAAIGALPYLFSGVCVNFFDAFFESMSGFTTTGATIFADVEGMPRGVIMWRGLTNWLGGMGIVVLLLAIVAGNGGLHMYKAEAPGNSLSGRLTPKIADTSQILWLTYVALTIAEIILLMFGGMPLYDAICQTFGTMSAGGFANKNASIGFYDSAYIQWVIIIFMFIAGSNFAFYYLLFVKRKPKLLYDEEFRVYFGIVIGAALVIAGYLMITDFYGDAGFGEVFRTSLFQVVSLMTTTGFATADFNLWPSFCKIILFSLFFIGGCTGSAAGSIKVARIIVSVKSAFIELSKSIHSKIVKPVKINGKTIPQSLTASILQFLVLYMLLMCIGGIVMSAFGFEAIEAFSSTAACLTNVGPGFGALGPASNFSIVPPLGKFFLSIYMLIGRLELFTVLVLLIPSVWKK